MAGIPKLICLSTNRVLHHSTTSVVKAAQFGMLTVTLFSVTSLCHIAVSFRVIMTSMKAENCGQSTKKQTVPEDEELARRIMISMYSTYPAEISCITPVKRGQRLDVTKQDLTPPT